MRSYIAVPDEPVEHSLGESCGPVWQSGTLSEQLRLMSLFAGGVSDYVAKANELYPAQHNELGSLMQSFYGWLRLVEAHARHNHSPCIEKLAHEVRAAHFAVWSIFGSAFETELAGRSPGEFVRESFASALSDTLLKHNADGADFYPLTFDSDCFTTPPDVMARLSQLGRQLAIDPDRACPQEGFAYPVGEEYFKSCLSHKGSSLTVLKLGNEISGFVVLLTDRKDLPENAKFALERLGANCRGSVGWVEIIGKAPELDSAHCQDENGVSPSHMLLAVAKSLASHKGIDTLLGEVRVGKQANTAMEKHLALGWQRTGIIRQGELHPYEIMLLDLKDVPLFVPETVAHDCGYLEDNDSSLPEFEDVISHSKIKTALTIKQRLAGAISEVDEILDKINCQEMEVQVWETMEGVTAIVRPDNFRQYALRECFGSSWWYLDDPILGTMSGPMELLLRALKISHFSPGCAPDEIDSKELFRMAKEQYQLNSSSL